MSSNLDEIQEQIQNLKKQQKEFEQRVQKLEQSMLASQHQPISSNESVPIQTKHKKKKFPGFQSIFSFL